MHNFANFATRFRKGSRAIADHDLRARDPQAHLNASRSAASRLDAAIAQLPHQCDPELRHYLERQSYLKALAWLETHQAEHTDRR